MNTKCFMLYLGIIISYNIKTIQSSYRLCSYECGNDHFPNYITQAHVFCDETYTKDNCPLFGYQSFQKQIDVQLFQNKTYPNALFCIYKCNSTHYPNLCLKDSVCPLLSPIEHCTMFMSPQWTEDYQQCEIARENDIQTHKYLQQISTVLNFKYQITSSSNSIIAGFQISSIDDKMNGMKLIFTIFNNSIPYQCDIQLELNNNIYWCNLDDILSVRQCDIRNPFNISYGVHIQIDNNLYNKLKINQIFMLKNNDIKRYKLTLLPLYDGFIINQFSMNSVISESIKFNDSILIEFHNSYIDAIGYHSDSKYANITYEYCEEINALKFGIRTSHSNIAMHPHSSDKITMSFQCYGRKFQCIIYANDPKGNQELFCDELNQFRPTRMCDIDMNNNQCTFWLDNHNEDAIALTAIILENEERGLRYEYDYFCLNTTNNSRYAAIDDFDDNFDVCNGLKTYDILRIDIDRIPHLYINISSIIMTNKIEITDRNLLNKSSNCSPELNPETKYILEKKDLVYEDARAYCMNTYGTYLATIINTNDIYAVSELIKQNIYSSVYIGLNDILNESLWSWEDGTICNYTSTGKCIDDLHWSMFNPDNANGNEDCAVFSITEISINDIPCDEKKWFLCAYGSRKNIVNNIVTESIFSNGIIIIMSVVFLIMIIVLICFNILYRNVKQQNIKLKKQNTELSSLSIINSTVVGTIGTKTHIQSIEQDMGFENVEEKSGSLKYKKIIAAQDYESSNQTGNDHTNSSIVIVSEDEVTSLKDYALNK